MKHSRLGELRTRAKIRVKNAVKACRPLSLKQALEDLAKKMAYPDWRSLKRDYGFMDAVYPAGHSRMLNLWFAGLDEARAHLKAHGGTLIPYGKQCFICDQHYLAQLGLAPDDADLQAVGSDWSAPGDSGAWLRLASRLAPPDGKRRKGIAARV